MAGVRRRRGRARVSKPVRKPFTEAERERIQAFLDDGVPYSEIVRTMHIGELRLKEAFPGYQQPPQVRGMYSAFARTLDSIPDRLTPKGGTR